MGKYTEIKEQCKIAKSNSVRGLQTFSEAMQECQKKVTQTLEEKMLVHINDNRRPVALVELQRKITT